MNRRDLVFTTARFNLSVVQRHFINPCCFGEDLLVWLRGELQKHEIKTTPPSQEDWGWYTEGSIGKQAYFIGVGGNAEEMPLLPVPVRDEDSDEEPPVAPPKKPLTNPNKGEWRIMIQKGRSFIERISRKNPLADDDKMVALVLQLLREQPDFENLTME